MSAVSIPRPVVTIAVLCVLVVALGVQRAQGGMIGYSVTGSVTTNFSSANRFEPANNSGSVWVDPSALNAGGPTVIIQEPGTEFGVFGGGGYLLLTADFTDTLLTLRLNLSGGYHLSEHVAFGFTSGVPGLFASVTEISDDFPGGLTPSASGNTLTIGMSQSQSFGTDTTYTAVYSITNKLRLSPLAL